jgi:hypothetical protein
MKEFKYVGRDLSAVFSIVFLVSVALFAAGCGSSLQLTSKWTAQKIQIDGDMKDWSDSTVFVEKDGIRCGVMNDGESIYVCLLSSKPNLGRQVMFRGMTVWFDPNGGQKKTIGIRFPIGMGRGVMPMRQEGQEGEETDQRGNRVRTMDRADLNDFEFLGPAEKDVQRVSRYEGQGIELHLTSTPERFGYELKIPISYSSSHPYAVETHAGAPIGVGFETNTPQRAAAPGGEGEGEGRGGGPGGGGRGGMRGGGMRGGGMRGGSGGGGGRPGGADVTFSFWTHVQLAEQSH